MIYQIILQLVMSSRVSDFLTHDEEGSKCSQHLVINIRKRTLPMIRFIVMHWMLPLILNDHVVYDHEAVITSHILSSDQVKAGYQTIQIELGAHQMPARYPSCKPPSTEQIKLFFRSRV